VAPLPGLPGQFELDGFIAPAWRRQGWGGHLLAFLLGELRETAVAQLSHAVTDLGSPAAHFLQKHGFTVEHEEWQLHKADLADCPPAPERPDLAVKPLRRARAIPLFCRLYAQSFGPFPWFQPYSEAEVAAALDNAADLLFLWRAQTPLGFAWIHPSGQIEPFGVVAEEQGRGNGRYLLAHALRHLAKRGASGVYLGCWADNQPALALYRSFGFQPEQKTTYLAYHLKTRP
jgi:ribosomal protein S18 acetylase RimI-like enzyme